MNKYDERYYIGLASKDDIDDVMTFIGQHWKKNHILSLDRNLFEYEFLDDDKLNFILARDKFTNEIEAIFGFLYCSNPRNDFPKDVWGSLWKVRDEHNNIPFLGVELAKRVYDIIGCRMHIGNGANPNTTIPLRKLFFKDMTGKMKQYYFLNMDITNYNIAKIDAKKRGDYIGAKSLKKVIELNDFDSVRDFFNVEELHVYPYKDNWYIEKRYFKHPYYKYKVWGLESDTCHEAIIFAREIEIQGAKILRIVDYIGNHAIFSETGYYWNDLVKSENYEYIDFFEHGIDDKVMLSAGFILREEDDVNIIPNYFEPFLQENVDIWFHYKYEGTTFFKADCDQDRPNVYRGEIVNEE